MRATDLDRELQKLRGAMEADGQASPGFDFYDPDVKALWNPPTSGSGPETADLFADDEAETEDAAADNEVPAPPAGRLRLAEVEHAVAAANLVLDRSVLAGIVAAPNSGKYVVLTGPPGTVKTSLAEAVGRVAAQVCAVDGGATATENGSVTAAGSPGCRNGPWKKGLGQEGGDGVVGDPSPRPGASTHPAAVGVGYESTGVVGSDVVGAGRAAIAALVHIT